MKETHPYYNVILKNPKIGEYLKNNPILTESLKETMERVIPYWNGVISKRVQIGQRILIVAHGTVLRSLIKYLEGE